MHSEITPAHTPEDLNTFQRYAYRFRRRLNRPRLVAVDEVFETKRLQHWAPVEVDTPEAVTMPLFPRAVDFARPRMVLPPIFSATVANGLFCTANNVLMKSPRRVVADTYEPWEAEGPASAFRSPFDATHCRNPVEPEPLRGVWTTYRSIRKTFYHMLLDNVPRIALLHHPEYAKLPEINVLLDSPMNAAEKYIVDRLLPSNCVLRAVKPDTVYRVERFIVLSHVTYRYAGGQHPEAIKFLQGRMLPPHPPAHKNRILISRRASTRGRRILNIDEVGAALRELGFVEYALEDLSLAEQIALFHDAEAVVGAHGAGLSNLIFAPAGTRVVELFGTPDVVPHYYFLAKCMGQDYSQMLGDREHLDNDFAVDVPGLLRLLQAGRADGGAAQA